MEALLATILEDCGPFIRRGIMAVVPGKMGIGIYLQPG